MLYLSWPFIKLCSFLKLLYFEEDVAPNQNIFRNDQYKCEIGKPEDWIVKVANKLQKPYFKYMIRFISLDYLANFVFLVSETETEYSPEQAMKIDLVQLESSTSQQFKTVSERSILINGLNGVEAVCQAISTDTKACQKRLYFTKGNHVYILVYTGIGEVGYGRYIKQFDEAVKSLKIWM